MHRKRRSNARLRPTFIIVVRPATWKVLTCLRLSISLAWPEIRRQMHAISRSMIEKYRRMSV